MPEDLAAAELKRAKATPPRQAPLRVLAAARTPGKPYTYRVHGPKFVVEFLNVQADSAKNPANHIHSAWRRLPVDFGLERVNSAGTERMVESRGSARKAARDLRIGEGRTRLK